MVQQEILNFSFERKAYSKGVGYQYESSKHYFLELRLCYLYDQNVNFNVWYSSKHGQHQNIINVIFFIIGTLKNVIESVSDVYKSSNFCYDVVVLNMGQPTFRDVDILSIFVFITVRLTMYKKMETPKKFFAQKIMKKYYFLIITVFFLQKAEIRS